MNVCDGYGSTQATFTRLTGSGTLSTTGGSSYGNGLTINDASGFTGTITLTKYKVTVGTSTGKSANGILEIESGKSITVAGATAPGGFVVNGTLVANGTLDSSAAAAVTGSGTVSFGGVPSPVDGENETKWWKNSAWTGTVEIKGASIAGNTYAFNDYGNASSTVKLTNCSGWLTPDYTCVPALEIGGTFTWNDGWSGIGYTFKVATLKGSGTISIPNQGAATAVWQITDDWSGFTGAVVGNNSGAKRVLVFGSTLPSSVTAGEIYISEGATLNLDNASSAWWGVGMGFVVDGSVKATNRSKWGGGTTMTLGDTGILEITRSDSAYSDDGGTDYGNVTGTGTIKFSGTGYTVLSQSIPTLLTFAAEKDSGSVVPVAGATIGSLTGSKGFRSDWGNNGEGGRYLTIKQSKDTAWDGSINAGGTHRLTGVVVDPGDSTTGTLTLTATQTASSTLTVNGSVNLTGAWVGATTVAGTFGGTGTLTGDLTFSDGATFKAFAADEDGLAVSGTVTCPAEGTVTVDVSAIEADTDVALLKANGLDADKFALAEGAPEGATLEVVEGVLTLKLPVPTTVEITIPSITGATPTVTADDQTVDITDGKVTVDIGAAVVVTYTANSGYVVTGDPIGFTASAETTTVDVSGISADVILATITSADGQTVTPYTSVATAFSEVEDGETLTLVGTAVTLATDVTVETSYTLAGDAEGTTVTGAGKIYLTGSAALTLDATLTSVGNQFWFSSKNATLTFPTGKSLNVRPFSGCQTGTTVNGDGTSTYYQYLFLQLQVGASNVTLAYYDSGDPLVTKQVFEGDEIVFTATPAEGYENPVVTANGNTLTPVDGKYTVVVGTVSVAIQATASQISDTYDVVAEDASLDANGQFTVPEGTTKIKIGDYTLVNGNGISIDGTTATLLAPAVVEGETQKAVDVGATTVTLNVTLVPGLYYGVGASEDLTIAKPAMTQYTGENGSDILTVNKPSAEKGFFKMFVDIKQ
ncbi:MAG: hypothetical protein J6W80_01330 [Kiritimatiellae bacterium]|nr:hypothetical protein [Kiritimatiellia bacterium]